MKGLPDGTRYNLSKANATNLNQFFKMRQATLRKCIQIPITYTADGPVTERANLTTQHFNISLADVQCLALICFGTEVLAPAAIPAGPYTAQDINPENNNNDKMTFYDQVDGSVLAKLIENVLTASGYQDLLLQQDSFSFVDASSHEIHYDGLTMSKILLLQIDPCIIIGMGSIKAQLETMKMHNFGNDARKMLTKMQSKQLCT